MRLCSVEGCTNKHEAKGCCKKHYRKFRKYGDPLYESKEKREYKRNREPRIRYEDNHKLINNVEHKKCSICEEWKPMNPDNFYKNKANSIDGLHPYCKVCSIKKNRKYAIENKESVHERYEEYYKKDREKYISYAAKWDRENSERKKKSFKEWAKLNRHKFKMYNERHRSHDIDEYEWEECKEYFNHKCAYCELDEVINKIIYNEQLHREHVIHDGSNGVENCVPACVRCNTSKSNKDFNEWYNEENANFTEERLNKIINWMTGDFMRVSLK